MNVKYQKESSASGILFGVGLVLIANQLNGMRRCKYFSLIMKIYEDQKIPKTDVNTISYNIWIMTGKFSRSKGSNYTFIGLHELGVPAKLSLAKRGGSILFYRQIYDLPQSKITDPVRMGQVKQNLLPISEAKNV